MLAMRSAAVASEACLLRTGHWHNVARCLLLMIHCSHTGSLAACWSTSTSDRQLFVPKAPSLHALLALYCQRDAWSE
jgi:hypothetical protein